jgi:hypothetical protein
VLTRYINLNNFIKINYIGIINMIKLVLLLLAFINHKKNLLMSHNNLNERWDTIIKINTNIQIKTQGYDQRYNESFNYTELYKFNKDFRKYNLLKILEDKKISTEHKLKLINNKSTYNTNLSEGGLFKDWNFTM